MACQPFFGYNEATLRRFNSMTPARKSSVNRESRQIFVFGAVFFLSGACGLVYEITWLKTLALVFGVTAFAAATVLAAFMAGLALGSFWLGRIADRVQRPLRFYGVLELGVGVFAFLMPLLFKGLDAVYAGVYHNLTQNFTLLSTCRFALSFLVLLLPAFLMGGTLPVMVRFFSRQPGDLGRKTSQLYFLNTMGAVVGSFTTGFLFIALLGVRETAYAAGTVNLLLGALAFVLGDKAQVQTCPTAAGESGLTQTPPPEKAQRSRRLALWAIAISGFCSLAYEVLWTRALVFILDNTAQAFTTMLTAFLMGIALGSLVVTRWIDRSRHLLLIFGAAEVAIGVLAMLSLPFFGNLSANLGGSSAYPTSVQWVWAVLRFGRAWLVMLLPTLLMGMTLPLAVRLYSVASSPGRAVGQVYGVNTLGGVAGSLGAGFFLIPLVGIHASVMAVAAVNAGLGIVLMLAHPVLRLKERMAAIFMPAVTYLTVLAILLAQGRVMFFSAVERPAMVSVPYYKEAAGATVKVYLDAFGDTTLSIDGFPVAGTIPRHQDAQRSLGNLPLLLSQVDQPRLNIVGFGAGGSSWAATLYDASRIECVELLPAVVNAAGFFPMVNHGVLSNPRLQMTIDDGRNHMQFSQETYDVISVDATSPKSAGSGNLYSLEFYQSCQKHLSSNGLMVEWLPYHLLTPEDLRLVARSFREVFPHATLWFSFERYYFLLVGTQQPLSLDFQRLTGLMGRAEIQEELGPLDIRDAYDVLSCYIMGERELGQFAGEGRLNSDDHPYLEYSPASSYLTVEEDARQNLAMAAASRGSVLASLTNIPAGQAAGVSDSLAARILATPPSHFFPQYLG